MSLQFKVGDWCQVINQSSSYDGLIGRVSILYPLSVLVEFEANGRHWFIASKSYYLHRPTEWYFNYSDLRLVSDIPVEEWGLVLSLQLRQTARMLAQIFRESNEFTGITQDG